MKSLTLAAEKRPRDRDVASYFDSVSQYWRGIYAERDVQAEIYRARQAAVLELVDSLRLPPGAAVLDAGCGAGGLAVELARRGLRVEAVDASRRMVEQARDAIAARGLQPLVTVRQGSVYRLPFPTGSFLVTVAVGLLPWLEDPLAALSEMTRVTQAGGRVIVTADNRRRLNAALDPWLNVHIQPLKRRLRAGAAAAHLWSPPPAVEATLHAPGDVDALLRQAGCRPLTSRTVGFGPFSLFRRAIVPAAMGVRLHHALQQLATAGRAGLADRGAHYLLMAERRND